MRTPEDAPGSGAVAVGNPQTAEFEVGGCVREGLERVWLGGLGVGCGGVFDCGKGGEGGGSF